MNGFFLTSAEEAEERLFVKNTPNPANSVPVW
jgi:hypothetical protein